ncbi:hypothetical protein V474_02155 [Novosphingobium barchaimii LL02]|uniref:Uncharacterized protein n=1 Tax=Novosphingobium barchaimii LL02 TaxID=1114963 RepID=A0A0J7XIL1_9SPHN|nr:hypothetical protein V474_02155 [Novosphingobium barchaimii LL02]
MPGPLIRLKEGQHERLCAANGQHEDTSIHDQTFAQRMDSTDICDVTGSTYDFLIDGPDTAGNWTVLFAPGERVRLPIINV